MRIPLKLYPLPSVTGRSQSRSKGLNIVLAVLATFLLISLLHVWLNIGFDKLRWGGDEKAQSSFKVGFLPVT